jgi:nucleoside-diphosphate-sugar epimerase
VEGLVGDSFSTSGGDINFEMQNEGPKKDRDIPTIGVDLIGGTGFLGRYLTKELSQTPGIRLRNLSRRVENPLCETVKGDLLHLDTVTDFLQSGNIVVNLAYDRHATPETNLEMAEVLGQACFLTKASRLIHCSTAMVYGNFDGRIATEETTCHPVTVYEKTKYSIEKKISEKLKNRCPVTILRPTAMFGKGGSNLTKLVEDMKNQNRLISHLRASLLAERRLHLICVENVAAAIRFLILRETCSEECFNVSDDESPRNNYIDVIRILSDCLGYSSPVKIPIPFRYSLIRFLLGRRDRIKTDPRSYYSGEKLRSLGFNLTKTLETGIREFLDCYKNERKLRVNSRS